MVRSYPLSLSYKALPSTSQILICAPTVLIVDPTFGLYLTFKPALPSQSRGFSFLSPRDSQPESLAAKRRKPLLLVNKHFRAFYLSHFPLSLPIGSRAVGQLRYAPSETIFISNLDSLIQDHDFGLAIRGDFRLQTWWDEVENLGVPVTALGLGPSRGNSVEVRTVYVVKKCKNVKQIRVHMWEGLENEAAELAMRASMQGQINVLRREIESLTGEEEVKGGRAVPEVVLV